MQSLMLMEVVMAHLLGLILVASCVIMLDSICQYYMVSAKILQAELLAIYHGPLQA